MSEAVGDMGEANGAIKEATGDIRELIKDIREEAIGDMKKTKKKQKSLVTDRQTCPSDKNPATSMTVVYSLGSSSGLLTPSSLLAMAISTPASPNPKRAFFLLLLLLQQFGNPNFLLVHNLLVVATA
jgi:hypothetical protein